jgi:hypothetical protein
MHQPFREHLVYLQGELLELTAMVTQPIPDAVRADVNRRIQLIQEAIDHYRRGYKIESDLRRGFSPSSSSLG